MKIQILFIFTLIGTILSAPMQTDTPTDPEDVESLIVFASNRGEDPNVMGLYILDTETEEILPIETDFESVAIPRWSPDGSQVLFSVPGDWNLYTIYPDGSEFTQVTDFRSNNADWSPDGSQIVFQSDHDNEPEDTPDIYIMDIDGENLTELVDLPEQYDFYPRWSPDGSQIIFISSRSGNFEVWLMNADGSNLTQFTESETPVINATWSPDAEYLVFTQITSNSTTALFIIDKEGSPDSIFQLTDGEFFDTNPVWSPDGEMIVFSSDRSGNSDLWTISIDGADLVQLTDDEFYDDAPDWGPVSLFEFEETEE